MSWKTTRHRRVHGDHKSFSRWYEELTDIIMVLDEHPSKQRIYGKTDSTVPVGSIEIQTPPFDVRDSLPEGYQLPPAGIFAGEKAEARAATTTLTYLEESVWTESSPDIDTLAQQLGNRPVDMYEYVLNTIKTEFYYGARQGAQRTLSTGRGNDVDQAALLIALYRSADIPCRFIRGKIELQPRIARNWTGLQNETSIQRLFAKAGIPCEVQYESGSISSLSIEHIWLEAYIPYDEYRGIAKGKTGYMWVPLAPAMKPYGWKTGQDVLSQMNLDLDGQINDYLTTHRPAVGPLSYIRQQIETYLNTVSPGTDYADVLYGGFLPGEHLGILPNTTPFEVHCINDYYAVLPDSLTSQVRFSASHQGLSLMDKTIPLATISDKKTTLAFEPASADDVSIVEGYMGLYNTPPYMVDVRGLVYAGDEAIIAFVGPIGFCRTFTLNIELISPQGNFSLTDEILAGNLTAIGIGSPAIGYEHPAETIYKADSLYFGQAATWLDEVRCQSSHCLAKNAHFFSHTLSVIRYNDARCKDT